MLSNVLLAATVPPGSGFLPSALYFGDSNFAVSQINPSGRPGSPAAMREVSKLAEEGLSASPMYFSFMVFLNLSGLPHHEHFQIRHRVRVQAD